MIHCRRYALFAGLKYYPGGGWKDWQAMCDSAEEARELFDALDTELDWEWAQVVDLLTLKVVCEVPADLGREGPPEWVMFP